MSVWEQRLEQRVGAARSRLPVRAGAGTVGLGAVAKFASGAGQSFFIAVFVDHLIAGAHVSRSTFSVLYAAATIASATIALGVGRVSDRAGVGRVWIGVATGLAAACAGLSLASGALTVLAALCFMRGFGQGSFPLLGTILVARRFDARRGRALSISALGLTASGFVLPLVGTGLISAFGWRSALQWLAGGILVLILPFGFLAGHRRRPGSPDGSARGSLREALRTPGVSRLLTILAVPPLVSTAIMVSAVSVLSRAGLGVAAAAAAISLSAVAGAFGNVIGGQLSDRFAPRVLLSVLGVTLGVAVLLLLSAQPALSLMAMVVLGLANGMSYTANGTVWAAAYGTHRMGQVQGLANAGQITGAAIGPLPLGLLLGATGTYTPGLAVLGALAVAAALGGWRWRAPGERQALADAAAVQA